MPPVCAYPELGKDAAALGQRLREANVPLIGGLSFDALILAAGYTVLGHLGLLVGSASKIAGGKGAIPLKDLHSIDTSADALRSHEGKQALQFFFTSLDGSVTFPMGYIAQPGDSAKTTFNAVKEIIEKLQKDGKIDVVFTSSDGFAGADEYVKMLSEYTKQQQATGKRAQNRPLVHVFDYTHLLKNLRNLLANNGFMHEGTFIALKHLHFIAKCLAYSLLNVV